MIVKSVVEQFIHMSIFWSQALLQSFENMQKRCSMISIWSNAQQLTPPLNLPFNDSALNKDKTNPNNFHPIPENPPIPLLNPPPFPKPSTHHSRYEPKSAQMLRKTCIPESPAPHQKPSPAQMVDEKNSRRLCHFELRSCTMLCDLSSSGLVCLQFQVLREELQIKFKTLCKQLKGTLKGQINHPVYKFF